MQLKKLIENLTNTLRNEGDMKVLLADPKNALGAYDINRGDIKRTGGSKVLVLVPNVQGLTDNSAIIKPTGGDIVGNG